MEGAWLPVKMDQGSLPGLDKAQVHDEDLSSPRYQPHKHNHSAHNSSALLEIEAIRARRPPHMGGPEALKLAAERIPAGRHEHVHSSLREVTMRATRDCVSRALYVFRALAGGREGAARALRDGSAPR